jgi:hypothetical protein
MRPLLFKQLLSLLLRQAINTSSSDQDVVCHSRFHSRSDAQRLMHAAEVAVVSAARVLQVAAQALLGRESGLPDVAHGARASIRQRVNRNPGARLFHKGLDASM